MSCGLVDFHELVSELKIKNLQKLPYNLYTKLKKKLKKYPPNLASNILKRYKYNTLVVLSTVEIDSIKIIKHLYWPNL